ncbi:MAG TPA: CRISPR-associated protein Csn1, partial [Desulfobulbus sp.]|nr:CRISPR-associated protein Csn1 [Desulfobulbus sp.]
MKNNCRRNSFILGLDLGTNSLGWSLVDPKEEEIVAMGCRIFSPAVTGDIDSGKEESNAATRREARQIRRQLWRRRRRKKKLFLLLQRSGLLPSGPSQTGELRHQIIEKLDTNIKILLKDKGYENVDHLLPYLLRKNGVTEKLSLLELGRALYHLGQRRGFESNRKQQNDDQSGVVREQIAGLRLELKDSGCRTLGQYFASLDPEKVRIRERYTHRSMYKEEFNLIWNTQAEFYPEALTGGLREEIYHALFFQRKLKNQKYLV